MEASNWVWEWREGREENVVLLWQHGKSKYQWRCRYILHRANVLSLCNFRRAELLNTSNHNHMQSLVTKPDTYPNEPLDLFLSIWQTRNDLHALARNHCAIVTECRSLAI